MIDYRKEYLINWWEGLWTQIRQKEDAIWRYISFYAAAIVLATGFINISESGSLAQISEPGIFVICLVLLLTSGWGINIVLDANYVHERNLLFISNAERELLEPGDLDVILPKKYAEKCDFYYSDSYKLHMHIFFLFLMAALTLFLYYVVFKTPPYSTELSLMTAIVAIFFSTTMIFILLTNDKYINSYFDNLAKSPGNVRTKQEDNTVTSSKREIPNEYIKLLKTRKKISSTITLWMLPISFVGSSFFIYIALRSEIWLPFSVIEAFFFSVAFPILGLFGWIGITLLRKVFYKDPLSKTSTEDNLTLSVIKLSVAKLLTIHNYALYGILSFTALIWLSQLGQQLVIKFNP